MDLFSGKMNESLEKPLADRMRPRTVEEFEGQDEILGEGSLLRRAIEGDRLTSLIFFGPPGTGKTTLAYIIAQTTKAEFQQINAVTSGIKEIRDIITIATEKKKYYQKKTILFIDEIHRFNKSQQDALLPAVEKGTVILIGATTENPYFEVNPPLVSRSRIFSLKPLDEENIKRIIKRALEDEERGLGKYSATITEEALGHLARVSQGDARTALNALELAVLAAAQKEENIVVNLNIAEESIQKKALVYDKDGDNHYDTISAFIKSIRGSDPDAALYWLAKMLYAGEDPKFISRRLIVHASEDIGMADPQALVIAVNAAQAVERVGLPEGRLSLAQATVYLATAPKSNAVYKGINEAQKLLEEERVREVPAHLRDSSYKGAKRLGHGRGYKYPHDYPHAHVPQNYLPEGLQDRIFYKPTGRGQEKEIAKRLKFWRNERGGKNAEENCSEKEGPDSDKSKGE